MDAPETPLEPLFAAGPVQILAGLRDLFPADLRPAVDVLRPQLTKAIEVVLRELAEAFGLRAHVHVTMAPSAVLVVDLDTTDVQPSGPDRA